MKKAALFVSLLAATAIVAGCAAEPTTGEPEKMVKIYRTGSNLPVMVPYMGAEHLRYIEASDKAQVDRTVSPPSPLRSN